MVPISSCKLNRSYVGDYTSRWYLGALNHADGAMREGNGDFGYADRQPGKWLLNQTGGSV